MASEIQPLSRVQIMGIFIAFAFAYFLSTLLRAITATLSPTLTTEFNLNAQDLGLLAGGYFLGFSLTQLPMGRWLDRHGPRHVIISFLGMAVIGCLTFAISHSFWELFLSRACIGIGVSACLMAPMTGYRKWMPLNHQQRYGSWMLMIGSLGMLSSTLPVQWLLPIFGWRNIFLGLAMFLIIATFVLFKIIPHWTTEVNHLNEKAQMSSTNNGFLSSYTTVFENSFFQSLIPLGFFGYGGLIAMQTLWAVPWMIRVSGYTNIEASFGLFVINITMLVTFFSWGMITPVLYARNLDAKKLMTYGIPLIFIAELFILYRGSEAGALEWSIFCLTSSVIVLSQSAIGMIFPTGVAGRALSAYNLILFMGVFTVQWIIGVIVDKFTFWGFSQRYSFSIAIIFLLCTTIASYLFFIHRNNFVVKNV